MLLYMPNNNILYIIVHAYNSCIVIIISRSREHAYAGWRAPGPAAHIECVGDAYAYVCQWTWKWSSSVVEWTCSWVQRNSTAALKTKKPITHQSPDHSVSYSLCTSTLGC